ncbi:hypothetical protein NMG60_11002637 [Bertholletia excelsa]
MDYITQVKLPEIDFSTQTRQPGSSSWSATRDQVVRALEEHGCFIATYDKVSLDLHSAVFQATKDLMDLPLETKMKNICKTPSHGYVGQEAVVPLYEGLGIENSTTMEGVQAFTKLMWPSGNDSFSETSLSFSRLVAELDQVVMSMVAEGYGIENDYETLLGATSYLLRFIRYRGPQSHENNLGLGLEIKSREGDWIVVEPKPSSFIVMAGDACSAWTNGRVQAPIHRVIMRGKEERYALGVFTFIKDVMLHVPKALVDGNHPLQYKPFDHYKFIDFYYTDEGKRSKCPVKAYCGV